MFVLKSDKIDVKNRPLKTFKRGREKTCNFRLKSRQNFRQISRQNFRQNFRQKEALKKNENSTIGLKSGNRRRRQRLTKMTSKKAVILIQFKIRDKFYPKNENLLKKRPVITRKYLLIFCIFQQVISGWQVISLRLSIQLCELRTLIYAMLARA